MLIANSEFGNYHIVRSIGGGGMAQIYLAKVKGLAGFEKLLALKVINADYAMEPRFVQMLIDEAKITVGLSHVNIAQVFDLGEVDGIYYIAMEYVEGLDILQLVNGLYEKGQRLPIETVAYVGRQVCIGLQYAHTKKDGEGKPLNVIHRDISPQNVLVSRAGEVKLVDFGIAKAAGLSAKTQAGIIKGKLNYMAPEQALGRPIDQRTDIFAVGIVLWEMLTAQMVYGTGNMNELAQRVRRAKIAPPSSVRREIPAMIDKIVMRALSPKPEERFQTAQELQVELAKFLAANRPNYGAPDLARLVEDVLGPAKVQPLADAKINQSVEILSREELLSWQSSLRDSLISANAAAPTSTAKLLFVADGKSKDVALSDRPLTIGRAGDLAIADSRISRQHAKIQLLNGRYVVEDLGSSNGTYVNDRRLQGTHFLRHDDVIQIGGCTLKFFLLDQTKVSQPESSTRLIIRAGAKGAEVVVQEIPLNGTTPIRMALKMGDSTVEQDVGQLTEKKGQWRFEQSNQSTLPLTVNGQVVKQACDMASGDTIELQEVSLRLSHDTKPFGVVS